MSNGPWDDFAASAESGPWSDFTDETPAGPIPSRNVAPAAGLSEQIVGAATGPGIVPAAPVPPEPTWAQIAPRALEGFLRNTLGAGGGIAQSVGELPTPVLEPGMPASPDGGYGTFGDGTAPAAAAEQGGGTMGADGGMATGGGMPDATYDTGARLPLSPELAAAGREVAVDQRQQVQKLREGIPEGLSAKGLAFDVVTNAPQIAVPLAIGAVNPAAGVAVGSALAGGTSFGNRYDELRNVRGLSAEDARQGAAVSATAELLTEKLALDAIIKTGKTAGLLPALKRIAVAAGAEGAQESMVQAIEEGYNAGVLGDATSLGDALSRVGYAGLVGAIVGGGTKGIAEGARSVAGGAASDADAPAGSPLQPPAPAAAGPEAAPPAGPGLQPPVAPAPADDINLAPADAADVFGAADPVPETPAAPTPDAQREQLRQRIEVLNADIKGAISPDVKKALKGELGALQKQVASIEFDMLADAAEAGGDAQRAASWRMAAEAMRRPEGPTAGQLTAKALKNAPQLADEEPTGGVDDGAVVDRGGEGGRADLGRSEAAAGRAGLEPAGGEGTVGTAAAAPVDGPAVAVEGEAGQPAAGLTAPEVSGPAPDIAPAASDIAPTDPLSAESVSERNAESDAENTAVAAPDAAVAVPDGAPAPAEPEPQEFEHAGARIYPIRVKGDNRVRWAVETVENRQRRADGKRAGMGDAIADTPDAARKEAERQQKQAEAAAARKAERDAAEAAERAKAEERKAKTAGKSLLEIKADDFLAEQFRSGDGKVRTRAQWVDEQLASGVQPSTRMVDKIQPMSRTRFNRATQAEQDAHERKRKAAGQKPEYRIGQYVVSKTEYDYAMRKRAEQSAAKKQESDRYDNRVAQEEKLIELRQRTRGNDLLGRAGAFKTEKAARIALSELPEDGEFARDGFGVYRNGDSFVLRRYNDISAGNLDPGWVDQEEARRRRDEARKKYMADRGLVEDEFGNMVAALPANPPMALARQELEALPESTLIAVMDRLTLAGRRMSPRQRVDALLAEDAEEVRSALAAEADVAPADAPRTDEGSKPQVIAEAAESAPESAAPTPIEDGETIVRVSDEPPVIDGKPAEAAHVDNGEAVPVTPAEVKKAVAKSPLDIKAARRDLLQKVDAAIAAAPDEDIYNTNGRLDDAAFVVFAVPGDGKFKVRNLKENLRRFADKVKKSAGFAEKSKPNDIPASNTDPAWRRTLPYPPSAVTQVKPVAFKDVPVAIRGLSDAELKAREAQHKAAVHEAANIKGASTQSLNPTINAASTIGQLLEEVQRVMVERGLRKQTDLDAAMADVERTEGDEGSGGDKTSGTAAVSEPVQGNPSRLVPPEKTTPAAESSPAPAPQIPDGMVPFGEPYYSGGELVQGYARFAKGSKARLENGAIVEVGDAIGAGPVFTRFMVRNEALGEFPAKDSELKPVDAAAPAAKPADGKLQDVGEKMAGARKDQQPSLDRDLSDQDIASMPLSEIWPAAEIEKIEDKVIAAVATASRAEIPAKPRTGYKVKAWVEKVKAMRKVMQDMTAGKLSPEKYLDELSKVQALQHFAAKVRLLTLIDRKDWGRIGEVGDYSRAFRYENGKEVPAARITVEFDGRYKHFEGAKTVAEVADQVRDLLAGPKAEERIAFEIRGNTKAGTYFINKVGDKEYRKLKTFTDVASARKFLAENYDEVLAAWEAVKDKDNVKKTDVRGEVNRDRTGPDHRKGRDVTAEDLATTFGFRGIEFGNWVGQGAGAKERQGLVNQAYDALMDLADVLGIPPKAMSLNGSLGLAFGSRGKGSAAAHFEPGNLVINLTKTKGAGALAHEWFHALDNYFARARGGEKPMQRGLNAQQEYREANYVTYKPERGFVHARHGGKPISKARLEALQKANPNGNYYAAENWVPDPKHPEGVRPEVEARFAAVVAALNESPMAARARKIDKVREDGDGYWSRIIERGARSFENYVIARLADSGRQNDFLANVTPAEVFVRDPGRYPYLLPSEIAPVAAAMDALFQTMQTRTDDAGRVGLFSRGGAARDSADVTRARAELNAELGADVVEALERDGQLVLHADESVLPESKRGAGIRGWYFDGVQHLFPQNIEAGNVASVLFHEATHRSAQEDTDAGLVLRALGMDGRDAMRRFERLRKEGSRRDREIAEEAAQAADREVEQLRAEGVPVGEERRQSETLAYLVELASAKPQGLSAMMRKLVADLVAALKAYALRSPFAALLPRRVRQRLADRMSAADFVRAARQQVQVSAAAAGGPGAFARPGGQAPQTKTPEFKRWFGDWELATLRNRLRDTTGSGLVERAAAQFIDKNLVNAESQLVATVSKDALGKMMSAAGRRGSVSPQAHYMALGNLDALFEIATKRLTRDGKKAGDAGDLSAVHHFDAPLPFDGRVLRVKIMAKEFTATNKGTRLYLVHAVEVDAGVVGQDPSVSGRFQREGEPITSQPPPGVGERFAQMVAAVNGEGVSKVVDADGRPLRVYHVTGADFDAFRDDRPVFVAFSEREAKMAALGSGKTLELYARAVNPANTREAPVHFLDVSKTFRENPEADAVYVSDEAGVSLALRSPSQLKSATGNIGAFDPADPRIAYSRQNRRDRAKVDFGADGTTRITETGRAGEARTRARVGKAIDDALRNRPELRDRADAARGKVRAGLLRFMTPRMLLESYGDQFADGSLRTYVEAGVERAEEKHRRARDAAELMSRWQGLPKQERDALAELMHDATLAGVRPNGAVDVEAMRSLARTLIKKRSGIEAGMKDREDGGTDRQRKAAARLTSQINRLAGLVANAEPNHAKLKARYDAMSAPAREVYDAAESALQKQFDEERAAQIRRIERLQVVDPDTGRYQPADAKLVQDLRERLDRAYNEAQGPEPYFPLKRFGDYVVRLAPHPDFEEGLEPVEFYESEVDAAARVRQLASQGYGSYQTTRSSFFEREFKSAAPEFMKEALDMIGKAGLPESDQKAIADQFHQLYLKSLPDASAMKSRIHRTGVPGFHQDAARSFAHAVLHGGNRIANLNHVDRMTQAIEDMKAFKDANDAKSDFATNTARQQLIDEVQMHLRDTLAPKHSRFAFGAQQLGFLWMLGGNVSTAVVNLTQTLQFTVPGLLSRFSTGPALAVFGRMAAAVGSPTRIQLNVDGKRLSVDAPSGLSATERAAYEELVRRGVISVTMAHDLAGIAERGIDDVIADTAPRKFWRAVTYAATLPQHTTERMNREIAAMSFYRLARQAGKSHEAAIDGAAMFAHETQFDYSAANRARAMRNPWVRVFTLFKTYAANVIYRQWRDIRTALGLNAATADERTMAARAFALRTAMVGMTTGATGIMGVSTVLGILDAVRDAFGDDDEPADSERDLALALQDFAGEGFGELMMHGALPRGAAERSNMSGLLIRDQDRDARDPREIYMRLLESAIGPVGSILMRGIQGVQDIRDGDAQRGIGTMLPNAPGALVKAARYADEGMLNRDGSPILEDLTPAEIAGQALGFTPSRSIPYWEEVNRQKNAELSLQEKSSKIRNRWAKAVLAEDAAAEAAAEADIDTWNERNPNYPIDTKSLRAAVKRLASSREAKAEGRYISKKAFEAITAEGAGEAED
ncbi:MAG: hypothetical protein C0434_08120 [Xanthomonadaceae bacterium]|nr:hypothetical protein [Xanthomonadaceae bacterium]